MTEPTRVETLRQHATSYRDRYASYHDHKEAMGYAGFALYVAAFGGGLLSSSWPPAFSWASQCWSLALCILIPTAAWLFALGFVRWQLLRRRLAAVRVAGSEELLNQLLFEPFGDKDLKTWLEDKAGVVPEPPANLWHFLWPPSAPLPQADLKDDLFYAALVAAWRRREHAGTQALTHERIVFSLGWLLWGALIIKTIASIVAKAA